MRAALVEAHLFTLDALLALFLLMLFGHCIRLVILQFRILETIIISAKFTFAVSQRFDDDVQLLYGRLFASIPSLCLPSSWLSFINLGPMPEASRVNMRMERTAIATEATMMIPAITSVERMMSKMFN